MAAATVGGGGESPPPRRGRVVVYARKIKMASVLKFRSCYPPLYSRTQNPWGWRGEDVCACVGEQNLCIHIYNIYRHPRNRARVRGCTRTLLRRCRARSFAYTHRF